MISISFPWVIIIFIYFYAPTVTRTYPSNSFMDGPAIDSILPILSVFVTAFRTIVQRGELQTLIPTVPEERTSPIRTLLLSCVLFLFSPVRLLFKPSFLLLVLLLLVAFFLLLTLPLVKENTRSHPGFGFGRFPYLNLAFQDARHFFVDLFHCYLFKNSPNSKNHQIESDSRDIWGQSHQPKRHKNLICDTHQKPQEIVLKTPPTKSSENQHKRERENHLEEQRRTIYTYHEGSYKV
jgi:hypothetical protein